MKIQLTVLSAVMAMASVAAVPQVANVRFSQDATTRAVTVTYDLRSAPAVVTMDVQTNGVTIGDVHIQSLYGAVNRRVEAGENLTITWYPENSWSGHRVEGNCKIVVKAWPVKAPPDIMSVDLRDGSVSYYTSTNAVPGEGNVQGRKYKTDCMVFRKIPAAGVRWRMGSPSNEPGHQKGSETNRWVTLTSDYYMAIYECTQAQCRRFKSLTTGFTVDADMRPAEQVQHDFLRGAAGKSGWPTNDGVDDNSFVGLFRARTGLPFDLPTEAEWEYACRAGTDTGLYTGEEISGNTASTCPRVAKLARYAGNSDKDHADGQGPDKGTAIVGSYQPNAWGLYDMIGNVSEKCLDRYVANLGGEDAIDPKGDDSAEVWTVRGSSWRDPAYYCRAANRGSVGWTDKYYSRGFRMSLNLGK